MGWADRANPRSTHGGTPAIEAQRARLSRFCAFFTTREEYEGYLSTRYITDGERAVLEGLLPPHLQVQGSV